MNAINIKSNNDIIREVIILHSKDILFGNNRDELNYVDCIYPYIEKIFGLDTCLLSINDPDVLNTYYEGNFNTSISYNNLLEIFNNVKKSCDTLINKDNIINIGENSDLNNIINNICSARKEVKTNVK